MPENDTFLSRFLKIHTLQPAGLRGVRAAIPQADMGTERGETHRVAVREPGGAWHEVLPALGHTGRGAPPEGGHAGDPEGDKGCRVLRRHAGQHHIGHRAVCRRSGERE